ncbi:MAG: hypothetical protein D6732_27905 [Methanobacteriota archaeon]|nr:MAG: hypothetical protein D6732_27905 [Euryarchaeota archaeon]
MKLNNVRFVRVMHKDVLEFFIIANSVPILHLYQTMEGDADSVLRAGRISAQDILGEETTGELIQKEVLSDSAIYYGRCGEILVALRVTSSMSDTGSQNLVEKALRLVEEYKELVLRSFGDKTTLNPLTERLNLLLGNKFPTNPMTMARINKFMDETMKRLDYIDRLALLTSEGWMVNILENDERSLGQVSKYAWRNAVEMLHLSLGVENESVVVSDSESFWFVYPLYFVDPLQASGTSWWAFVIQVNRQISEKNLLENIQNEIETELLDPLTPMVVKMLERETRNFGLTGPIGRLFSLVEYMGEENFEIKFFGNKIQLISVNERGYRLMKEFAYQGHAIFGLIVKEISELPQSTAFASIPRELFEELFLDSMKSIDSSDFIFISLGSLHEITKKKILEEVKFTNHKVLVDHLEPIQSDTALNFVKVNVEAQVDDYAIFLKNGTIGKFLLIGRLDAFGNYFTLLSADQEFINLAKNQIEQFELL